MKQLIMIAALLVQTAYAQTGDMKRTDFKIPIPRDFLILPEPDIIASNWFSLSLKLVKDQGETFLQGEQPMDIPLQNDERKFVEMVYVSIPGEQGTVIKILPAKIVVHPQSPDVAFCFRYVIDKGVLRLQVKNPDPAALSADVSKTFSGFRYRYILVPKSVYQAIKTDWSNYEATALALNL